MRKIKYIVVHTTATPQTASIESIKNYWRNVLKWKAPGYHFIITPGGEIVNIWPIEKVANGVAGYNSACIHISYIGGAGGLDNRTPQQKAALINKLTELKRKFPAAKIQGHRDFPKVAKSCPNFNAIQEYAGIR